MQYKKPFLMRYEMLKCKCLIWSHDIIDMHMRDCHCIFISVSDKFVQIPHAAQTVAKSARLTSLPTHPCQDFFIVIKSSL